MSTSVTVTFTLPEDAGKLHDVLALLQGSTPTAPPIPQTAPAPAPIPAAIPAAVPAAHAAPAVPAAVPSYTLEQLARAATPILDSGRGTEIVSVLNTFGVQSLTQLPQEQYGAFAVQLRALGAQI